jgi:hypothetical protein
MTGATEGQPVTTISVVAPGPCCARPWGLQVNFKGTLGLGDGGLRSAYEVSQGQNSNPATRSHDTNVKDACKMGQRKPSQHDPVYARYPGRLVRAEVLGQAI